MSAAEYAELAVVVRSGVIESRHFGSLAALDAEGTVAAELGDTATQVLPRSTLKPLQALACLAAGADLAGEELAIACGSHTGEDVHVAVVRRILVRAGLDENALQCPPDLPEDGPTRERLIRAGEGPTRIRMNCSGKHAAMLLACASRGWDTASYLDPDHPLQRVVRETVERMTREPVQHTAVDGCGAPVLSTSLPGIARAFRGLVTAPPDSLELAVADAMRTHPAFVGGDRHANTDVMRFLPGVLAKGGAEGVIGMAAATGQAVAVKVVDGGLRATTLIALAVLDALGADTAPAESLATVPVLGGGRPVGAVDVGHDLADWAGESR